MPAAPGSADYLTCLMDQATDTEHVGPGEWRAATCSKPRAHRMAKAAETSASGQRYRRAAAASMAAASRNGRDLVRPVARKRVVRVRSGEIGYIDITGIPAPGQADRAVGLRA